MPMSSLITTLGLQQASAFCGVDQTEANIGIAFQDSILSNYVNTHLLVAFPCLSLRELVDKMPERFLYSWNEAWYNMWPGSLKVIPPGWYLVPRNPTPEDLVPCAVACYTALVLNEPIFTGNFWPCLEVDQYGKHVCIQSNEQGLYLTWDPGIHVKFEDTF
jgi:hypothetical protein